MKSESKEFISKIIKDRELRKVDCENPHTERNNEQKKLQNKLKMI